MLNYGNLSDVEFEYLCQDIMEKKLGIQLRRFASGRDGGIDLTDRTISPKVVVQVKHYLDSPAANLVSALKKEVPKVKKLAPEQYYICCARTLTPQRVKEIYEMFSDYMDSEANIVTLNEIEDFLQQSSNREALEKHYKLWLDSTGIFQTLLDGNIFADCEVLLAEAEQDKKLFVRTQAFDTALQLLSDGKILFLIGDPGVGKTMTSKMLVLHHGAMGYRVRYSSNTSDLAALKRSLAREPDVQEIILIDDCFGQAYFDLKDSQNSDLLALIKYIYLSSNKRLILNSRVTIFQEAKERKQEFVRSLENKEFGVYILNMSAISELEKAKIFYNHIYANGIGQDYFAEIKKDRRYREIINHKNYNPRIIEFICNPNRYREILPEKYYPFIRHNLDNPSRVWEDEYERRLQPADRILLLSVFSLTDTTVEEGLVKACFERWIAGEPGIDKTINQYEASLHRLTHSFLRLVDENGRRKLGVVNPSVNDYLDFRLKTSAGEREYILKNLCSPWQFFRLLSPEERDTRLQKDFNSGNARTLTFSDDEQRQAFLAWGVATYQIQDEIYQPDVYGYLRDPSYLFFTHNNVIQNAYVLEKLLIPSLIEYYHLGDMTAELNIRECLRYANPEETVRLVSAMSPLFQGPAREEFLRVVGKIFVETMEEWYTEVDAAAFDPDVGWAVREAVDTADGEFDEMYAAELIEGMVEEQVRDEIKSLLLGLPEDLVGKVSFVKSMSIDISGVYSMVDSYWENDVEYDPHISFRSESRGADEIDLMFNR